MLILSENTDIFSFFLIKDTRNTHNLNISNKKYNKYYKYILIYLSISLLKISFQFSREIPNCSEFSWEKKENKNNNVKLLKC